jgi:hypothetical protein
MDMVEDGHQAKVEASCRKEPLAEEMCEAAMHGKEVWIKLLISQGADVNACDGTARS